MSLEREVGGRLHLTLHIGLKPIANKYHEGKVNKDFGKKVKRA